MSVEFKEKLPSSSLPSVWKRFVALVIDGLILSIPVFLVNLLIPYIGGLIVGFFYAPILEASELKGTIGKCALGIQVVSESGTRLTFKAALIRYVIKILSSMFLFVGHIVAFFTPKKQAIHDLLAGSVVVYGTSYISIMTAWVREIKSGISYVDQEFENVRDPVSQIERLKILLDNGALTQEEFETEKRKILNDH